MGDLTNAHAAVRRAQEQLGLLDPSIHSCDKDDDPLSRRTATERQRDAVRIHVSELKTELLERDLVV